MLIIKNYIQLAFIHLGKVGLFFLLAAVLVSCGQNQVASPKPRAFPKVDFQEKKYEHYKADDCSFQFEYPIYSEVVRDNLFMNEESDQTCWFDIVFPKYNARLHCSYYEINQDNRLDSLIYDAFALVGKHTIKAQYIEETVIEIPGGGGGILFDLSGPVASPTQFFITDSTNHFIRGSLYFNNKVQIDSMKVIYDYINEDIDQMLESFIW